MSNRVAIIAVAGSACEQGANVISHENGAYLVHTDPSFIHPDGEVLTVPAEHVRELNTQGCVYSGTTPYRYCGVHFTRH